MALVVIQITISDEDTGIVEQTFVEAFTTKNTYSWEVAPSIQKLLTRVFNYIFPGHNEW